MLQALAGQRLVEPAVALAGTGSQAQHLQRVGGIGRRLAQATAQQPGHAARHRRVLPRGQQPAVAGMRQRLVVEVLADVGLVQPDGGPGRQRQVLQVDQVQPQRQRAGVVQLHMPEPGVCCGRQHQLHPVLHTAPIALVPHAATVRLLAARRRRPQQGHWRGAAIGLMAAQPEVGGAGLQRAGGKQVDRQPAATQHLQPAVGLQHGLQPAVTLGQNPRGRRGGIGRHGRRGGADRWPQQAGWRCDAAECKRFQPVRHSGLAAGWRAAQRGAAVCLADPPTWRACLGIYPRQARRNAHLRCRDNVFKPARHTAPTR